MADQQNENYEKIFFRLEPDEHGYPPTEWETLWGFEVGPQLYSIDNVPFFVQGISWKDIVSVKREEDGLHFKEIVEPSGHSVLRVMVFDESMVADVRQTLQQKGCDTELSHIPGLFSVDCPPTIALNDVLEFLATGEEDGRWDYEEASIRQDWKDTPIEYANPLRFPENYK
jgi:hypothetical protein